MSRLSEFSILPQPTDTTCGPTCLQAVYRHFGMEVGLGEVIARVKQLDDGGTLAAWLACDALRRGYRATIYTYNLQLFDPTWFTCDHDLVSRLRAQSDAKPDAKLREATDAYLRFLELGGIVRFDDLKPELLRRYLRRNIPILTGLSATYLHHSMREHGPQGDEDDVRGLPIGHFVVLCEYSPVQRLVRVADPLHTNPHSASLTYEISIDRVVGAILLGVLTYDANLLIIEPRPDHRGPRRAAPDHR